MSRAILAALLSAGAAFSQSFHWLPINTHHVDTDKTESGIVFHAKDYLHAEAAVSVVFERKDGSTVSTGLQSIEVDSRFLVAWLPIDTAIMSQLFRRELKIREITFGNLKARYPKAGQEYAAPAIARRR